MNDWMPGKDMLTKTECQCTLLHRHQRRSHFLRRRKMRKLEQPGTKDGGKTAADMWQQWAAHFQTAAVHARRKPSSFPLGIGEHRGA